MIFKAMGMDRRAESDTLAENGLASILPWFKSEFWSILYFALFQVIDEFLSSDLSPLDPLSSHN